MEPQSSRDEAGQAGSECSAPMTDAVYAPIEDYGLVGNLETCALVAPDGSVDWFPFPHVESPSILAAILDADEGGHFTINPAGSFEGDQQYVDGTAVLETTFETADGTATVTDFLPPAGEVDHPKKVLYRKVVCREGRVDLDIEFEPQFDYGRADATFSATEKGIRAEGREERTVLESPVDLDVSDGRAKGHLSLADDESAWFLLRCTGAEDADADPEAALRDTIGFWREWVHECDGQPGDCVFSGPWHDLVVRSGITLKLLTHAESGAIAAAPTTSLPEDVGGIRNWDYRFNWLRDAGFTVQALSHLGHLDQATDYFDWFLDLCDGDNPGELQPLYGLHGDVDLQERELDHFEGYRGSRPVRVGNDAADQRQLDIYGELLLAVDQMLRYDQALDEGEWEICHDIIEHVSEVWEQPDAGIWEVRGDYRHFVYSKVMCWVALDRGIAIAAERGHDAPLDEWRDTREAIHADVLRNGYDEDLGAFVQSYGSTDVDATGLLLPIVGFLPFDDDRVQGTIETVRERLVEDGSLVRRYDGDDGLPGEEGAFVLCACWLVDALALSGRVEEATDRFESLLEYVNDLGLVAEELDPESGAYLGNYPQAFSHIGLVNSALYLGHARGYEPPGPPPMGIRLGDPVEPDSN